MTQEQCFRRLKELKKPPLVMVAQVVLGSDSFNSKFLLSPYIVSRLWKCDTM